MKISPKIKDDLYNFSVGFCMGSANIIPGVSGGTMLFIMGAFGKLINALRELASFETLKMIAKLDLKGLYARIQWRFLAGLGLGILAAFASLAKFFVWMLEKHQSITFAFFFGLIAASIISVNRQIKKWSISAAVSGIISAAVAFTIISLVPVDTGDAWYMMILCGAICIIAMILPGLSGSFLLLVLGQYNRIWEAVGNLSHLKFNAGEISTLLLTALGCIIGLGAFVHLLNFLMERYYNPTIAALIGFMIGSLPKIWPWQSPDPASLTWQKGEAVYTRSLYHLPEYDNGNLLTLLCCIAAGLALILAIEYFAGKKQNAEDK